MAWAIHNRLLFAVIFLSGFAALVYQLVWVRLLGLVFGVSSFAVATVVAVFLLGLGLGSYYFGKRAERLKNPLGAYMWVELAVAALSILSYLIICKLPLYEWLYAYAYNNLDFYGLSLVRLLLSTLVLLPPVFAIGGTMPLISKYFLTNSKILGSNFSRMYYMNTLGAFAGAIVTGFFLVKYLGVFLTLMTAVVMNLIVAALICVKKTETETAAEAAGEKAPYAFMLIILFFTGFISLSYEVLWVRILSTYAVSTSQAFALIVSGFLMGFSLGSYLVSIKIDALRDLKRTFANISMLTAASGALVLFVFQRFGSVRLAAAKFFDLSILNASFGLAFAVSLVPAVFMGMLFPLGLRIYAHDIEKIGAKTGKVFFFNTLGSVMGSLAAGFVLIPFVGMWNTTLILVNLSLAVAFCLFVKNGRLAAKNLIILLLVCGLANILVFSDKKTFHRKVRGHDVLYYSEGLSGTVTVLERKNIRGLFVDGQHVAGTDPVLTIDSKMLAHLPLLLARKPERALTVGYGTGGTSYSMLLHGVDVFAVEIEPEVVKASRMFKKINFNSNENPRLNIIIDDARNYIDRVEEKFDTIVTDVTNLKYKRNPYLYTKEYFEIMEDALKKNGVAAAWLPLAGLSFNDLKILIRTFDRVYPHTTVWFFNQRPTHFIIVMGTQERLALNLNRLERDMKKAKQDLQSIKVDNQYEIASMLLLGESDVDGLVSGRKLHTDNFPVLEFSDMGLYMQADLKSNLKKLLRYRKEDLTDYFIGSRDQIRLLDRHFKSVRRSYEQYIRSRGGGRKR